MIDTTKNFDPRYKKRYLLKIEIGGNSKEQAEAAFNFLFGKYGIKMFLEEDYEGT